MATNILAKRLDDFVADGLMERRQAAELQLRRTDSDKQLDVADVVAVLR